jgi:hypothetical protein
MLNFDKNENENLGGGKYDERKSISIPQFNHNLLVESGVGVEYFPLDISQGLMVCVGMNMHLYLNAYIYTYICVYTYVLYIYKSFLCLCIYIYIFNVIHSYLLSICVLIDIYFFTFL